MSTAQLGAATQHHGRKTLAGASFAIVARISDGEQRTHELKRGCLISFLPSPWTGFAPSLSDFSFGRFEEEAHAWLGWHVLTWTATIGKQVITFNDDASWFLILSVLESHLQGEESELQEINIWFTGFLNALALGYDLCG